MTVRRTAAAVVASSLLLTGLVAPTAGASQITVGDNVCTVSASVAEYGDFVSAAGVFAAHWAAEVVRDLPAAAADMSTARAWYADKTSTELENQPEEIRAAEERIDAAGVRAGYREGEALAPLQLLLARNDRRANGAVGWFDSHRMTMTEARDRLSSLRLSDAPAVLTASRQDLSVPAEEAWLRAWNSTPQILTQHEATLAELELCAEGTAGEVDRASGDVRPAVTPVPGLTVAGGLVGIIGGVYASTLRLIAQHVPELRELFFR